MASFGQRKKHKKLAWEAKKLFSEEAQNKCHSVVFVFSLLTYAAIHTAVQALFWIGKGSQWAIADPRWLKSECPKKYPALKVTPVIQVKLWCHRLPDSNRIPSN